MKARIATALIVIAGAAVAAVAALAAGGSSTGPSSSQSPYLIASQDRVAVRSILTVGDTVGGYQLAGIPDGLGAIRDKRGTFTLLVNHEIVAGAGAVRAHGANGAFVSRWTIDGKDLAVQAGGDLIQRIATWNPATGTYNAPAAGIALSRLCSANLPDEDAFYDKRTKAGYDEPLFMNGEEAGAEGRAFAHALDGTSYQLPALGRFSWENSVANPDTGAKTVVVGTDDSTPGQIYVYVGDKKKTGNPVERAGLTGGTLYGIKVAGTPLEPAGGGIPSGTAFSAAALGDVSALTGGQLEALSDSNGVTEWQRPEDAEWDPKHPNDLYFVITANFAGNSKLYRLRFNDPANPAAGGTVEQLLTGSEDGGTGERFHMLDNIAVDRHSHVLLQEDPGNQAYLARIWQYDIKRGTLTEVARHDPARFSAPAPGGLTIDEEASGIIDAERILGKGWFLLDVEAHYPNGPTLVEGGQLLALHVPKLHPDKDE